MEPISREELERMKNTDIQNVDPNSLVDIQDVTINTELSQAERILDFMKQIKNPYCFKYKGIIVKLTFADTDETFEDLMESYLKSL